LRLNCFARRRISAEIVEDTERIDPRGRFDDPGDDQVLNTASSTVSKPSR